MIIVIAGWIDEMRITIVNIYTLPFDILLSQLMPMVVMVFVKASCGWGSVAKPVKITHFDPFHNLVS